LKIQKFLGAGEVVQAYRVTLAIDGQETIMAGRTPKHDNGEGKRLLQAELDALRRIKALYPNSMPPIPLLGRDTLVTIHVPNSPPRLFLLQELIEGPELVGEYRKRRLEEGPLAAEHFMWECAEQYLVLLEKLLNEADFYPVDRKQDTFRWAKTEDGKGRFVIMDWNATNPKAPDALRNVLISFAQNWYNMLSGRQVMAEPPGLLDDTAWGNISIYGRTLLVGAWEHSPTSSRKIKDYLEALKGMLDIFANPQKLWEHIQQESAITHHSPGEYVPLLQITDIALRMAKEPKYNEKLKQSNINLERVKVLFEKSHQEFRPGSPSIDRTSFPETDLRLARIQAGVNKAFGELIDEAIQIIEADIRTAQYYNYKLRDILSLLPTPPHKAEELEEFVRRLARDFENIESTLRDHTGKSDVLPRLGRVVLLYRTIDKANRALERGEITEAQGEFSKLDTWLGNPDFDALWELVGVDKTIIQERAKQVKAWEPPKPYLLSDLYTAFENSLKTNDLLGFEAKLKTSSESPTLSRTDCFLLEDYRRHIEVCKRVQAGFVDIRSFAEIVAELTRLAIYFPAVKDWANRQPAIKKAIDAIDSQLKPDESTNQGLLVFLELCVNLKKLLSSDDNPSYN
jgi:hypothetical protein